VVSVDHLPDEELLRRTPVTPAAFGVFYTRHERALLAWLVRQVRDPEVAADLCSETFAEALVSIARFRPDRGDAKGWLFGIARHQVGRHRRRGMVDDRARRRLGLQDVGYTDAQLEAVAALGSDVRVEVLLDGLPPEQASAIRGRVLEERAYRDLADRAGLPEQTIRQRVSRGLAALRPRMEGRSK
jgi:RNA polymerase sigma factor (sigma-70 family)